VSEPPQERDELLKRIESLERRLNDADEEIGSLRLQLDVLSTIDPPTGLLNRNGLLDALDVALMRLERQREPFALMLIRLPEMTDIARHHPGSFGEASRHVTALFTAGLRALDRTARLSLEVFAGVLALTIESDVPGIIRRLGTLLTAAPITVGKKSYETLPTFSIVLVGSGQKIDGHAVLALAEASLEKASPDHPAVQRI
jgi:GGDEF domain-containing protein